MSQTYREIMQAAIDEHTTKETIAILSDGKIGDKKMPMRWVRKKRCKMLAMCFSWWYRNNHRLVELSPISLKLHYWQTER